MREFVPFLSDEELQLLHCSPPLSDIELQFIILAFLRRSWWCVRYKLTKNYVPQKNWKDILVWSSHTNASPAHAECPFEGGCGVTAVCGGVYAPGGPIQTVCLTFNTLLLPISLRSPRWYRKHSSHIVLQCRQIAYNNRQRPFIFPCQRFAG